MTELAHGYRVIVKFKDGTEAVYEYLKEKVADGVVRRYMKRLDIVKSVEKEEF